MYLRKELTKYFEVHGKMIHHRSRISRQDPMSRDELNEQWMWPAYNAHMVLSRWAMQCDFAR